MRILSRKERLCVLGVLILITGVMLALTGLAQAQFEQPGTQPKEHDFQFHDVKESRVTVICRVPPHPG